MLYLSSTNHNSSNNGIDFETKEDYYLLLLAFI